jgi:serine/threonine protein kinase/tetratricopeptide (TPR) repeat protein
MRCRSGVVAAEKNHRATGIGCNPDANTRVLNPSNVSDRTERSDGWFRVAATRGETEEQSQGKLAHRFVIAMGSPNRHMSSTIPTIGAPYRLDALAGTGGSGAVYRGKDARDGSLVAVKVVTFDPEAPANGASYLARKRFLREAETLKQLSHAHVVEYLDHGSTDSFDYLVMRWVSGVSLRDRLRHGRLDDADVMHLARNLCDALAYLAAHAIVHRDIKPENIMLRGGDVTRPVVVDLGIAQRSHGESLTQAGALLGTPRYMAPEQIRSPSKVDDRADVFSLGCVLFECFAGKPVFEDDDPVTLLARVLLDNAPRLRSHRPEIAVPIDEAIARLLARNPARRPRANAALADLFAESLIGVPDSAIEPPVERQVERPDEQPVALPVESPTASEARYRDMAREPAAILVGRSQEKERALHELRHGGCLVVWAAIGQGKTHLANEVIRTLRRPIRAVSSGAPSLASALASLGTSEECARDFWDAQEDLCVFFDAADGYVDALCNLAPQWHQAAPHVYFVCTTRTAPLVRPSWMLVLGPLETDDGITLFFDHVSKSGRNKIDSQLLEVKEAVRDLVIALEGNPLMIELAARRYDILGLRGLLQRATRSTNEPRGPQDERLRESIAFSLQLLDQREREVLEVASIFQESFSFERIGSLVPRCSEASLFEVFEGLLRRSLIRSEAQGSAMRFRVSSAIREYVEHELHLANRWKTLNQHLHAHYMRTLVPESRLYAETGKACHLRELTAEADQVDRLLVCALERHEPQNAVGLCLVMEPVWTSRGALNLAKRRLEQVLALAEPGKEVAQLNQAYGRILAQLGLHIQAESILRQVLTFADAHREDAWRVSVLVELGVVAHHRHDLKAAGDLYRLALAESAGDGSRVEARALANLGALSHDAGDHDLARAYYVEATSVLEQLGDERHAGICAGNLAVLELDAANVADAEARFQQALGWLQNTGDNRLLGITFGNYAMLHFQRDDVRQAALMLRDACTRLASTGDGKSEALALSRLGGALATLHEREGAVAAFARAERLAVRQDPQTRRVVDGQRLLLDLADARQASLEGQRERAAHALASARTRYTQLTTVGDGEARSLRDRSDDIRALLRIAEPALAALA